MKVYTYDENGYLNGENVLDDSDKCPITKKYLIPGMATDKEPLENKENYTTKWNGLDWEYEKILTDDEKKVQGLLELEEGEKIENGDIFAHALMAHSFVYRQDGFELSLDLGTKLYIFSD